jgi:hypothetical protein
MLLVSIRLPAQSQSTKSPAAPEGWFLAGSNPGNYGTGLDPEASYHGLPSAYLKAKQSAIEGFGTLMQEFSAGHYAGKRVRLSASVKADEVKSGSVWLNSVKFESVGLDVPTTAKAPARLPEGPANLKFEN